MVWGIGKLIRFRLEYYNKNAVHNKGIFKRVKNESMIYFENIGKTIGKVLCEGHYVL